MIQDFNSYWDIQYLWLTLINLFLLLLKFIEVNTTVVINYFFLYSRGKCDFEALAQNSKNDRFHESLIIFELQYELLVYCALR